jgi:hypothetical protein
MKSSAAYAPSPGLRGTHFRRIGHKQLLQGFAIDRLLQHLHLRERWPDHFRAASGHEHERHLACRQQMGALSMATRRIARRAPFTSRP